MRVLLGLGANLGDPPAAFAAALAALPPAAEVLARSGLYRSHAVGPPQPDYWNAAVLLDAHVGLLALLERCQELEAAAGRVRGERWGPRPLDLDLLVADGAVHRGPRLELPHPRFVARAFALVPAAEVAPAWRLPGGGATLAELARRVDASGVRRVAPG